MRRHAVGMVVRDRWEHTYNSLNSIYYCDQDKTSFDLFLIDNGSEEGNVRRLKDYIKTGLLPIKNAFFIKDTKLSVAWNLFLSLTKKYDYRTKYDNDLVLQDTIVTPIHAKSASGHIITSSSPDAADPLAGAPRSAGVIRGIGQTHSARDRRTNKVKKHSAFLNHMVEFGNKNNVDIVALVPVNPTQTFGSMHSEVIKARSGGKPYLFGACMMITRKAFENLGYFDERLPRRLDIEYTQRALRNKFNIGYHPGYGVTHIGAGKSTEDPKTLSARYTEASRITKEEKVIDKYATSEWEKFSDKINYSANNNKILTMK